MGPTYEYASYYNARVCMSKLINNIAAQADVRDYPTNLDVEFLTERKKEKERKRHFHIVLKGMLKVKVLTISHRARTLNRFFARRWYCKNAFRDKYGSVIFKCI